MIDPGTARRIRLLGLDVDGVLTDNAVFVGEVAGERVEFKRFDIQDGLAVGILRKSGIQVALVSGRWSRATELRAQELRIEDVIQDSGARKVPAFGDLLTRKGIGWEEVAFVGDDLADLPVLRRVGLPIAVANAVREVREAAAWVTTRPGGQGAVREVIEALMTARGEWDAGVRRYIEERDGAPA